MARRGFAQEKSVDELLAVLDSARALNLTHITDNIRHKPSFICNCCSCCCELLAGVQMGYHNGIAKTGFRAVIDPSAATAAVPASAPATSRPSPAAMWHVRAEIRPLRRRWR